MRKFLFLLAFTGLHMLFAQKEAVQVPNRIVIGTSLTYIWDYSPNILHEYTWSINAAYSPFKNFYVGANLLNIWARGPRGNAKHSDLVGLFTQYRLGKYEVAFLPELGFYRGNYCTCGEDTPFKMPGLNYLSVGGGFNWRIYRGLQLETSFLVYNILNRIPQGKYSYTQYVIGLNYEFGWPKKQPKAMAYYVE